MLKPSKYSPKLIIALDFAQESAAWALVDQLNPSTCALKVGSELFTRLGPTFIRALQQRHFKVFLDLKFHDIPHTVAKACQVVAELGVWMCNVHASGGQAMLEAARKALDSYGENRPLLIAVTVLTSMRADDLISLGMRDPLTTQVARLAQYAHDAGLDGVVSSAMEVPQIKAACGHSFLTVTPGIRLSTEHSTTWQTEDDQHRVMTPAGAIQAGSDFLVIGRPVTRAADPHQVIQQILTQICDD